jgi:hypothetical protein
MGSGRMGCYGQALSATRGAQLRPSCRKFCSMRSWAHQTAWKTVCHSLKVSNFICRTASFSDCGSQVLHHCL